MPKVKIYEGGYLEIVRDDSGNVIKSFQWKKDGDQIVISGDADPLEDKDLPKNFVEYTVDDANTMQNVSGKSVLNIPADQRARVNALVPVASSPSPVSVTPASPTLDCKMYIAFWGSGEAVQITLNDGTTKQNILEHTIRWTEDADNNIRVMSRDDKNKYSPTEGNIDKNTHPFYSLEINITRKGYEAVVADINNKKLNINLSDISGFNIDQFFGGLTKRRTEAGLSAWPTRRTKAFVPPPAPVVTPVVSTAAPVPSSSSPTVASPLIPGSTTTVVTPPSASSSPPAPLPSSTAGVAADGSSTTGTGATGKGSAVSSSAILTSLGSGSSASGTSSTSSSTASTDAAVFTTLSSSIFPEKHKSYTNEVNSLRDNQYLICLIWRPEPLNSMTLRIISKTKGQLEFPIKISDDNKIIESAGASISDKAPYDVIGEDVRVLSFARLSNDKLNPLTLASFKNGIEDLHSLDLPGYLDEQLKSFEDAVKYLISKKPAPTPAPVSTTSATATSSSASTSAATSLPVALDSTPAVSISVPGFVPTASPSGPTAIVPPVLPATVSPGTTLPASAPVTPGSPELKAFIGSAGTSILRKIKDNVASVFEERGGIDSLVKATAESLVNDITAFTSPDFKTITINIPTKVEGGGLFSSAKATAWAQVKATSQSVSLEDGRQFNHIVFAAMVAAACENLCVQQRIYPLQLDLDLRKLGITTPDQYNNLNQIVTTIITDVSKKLAVPNANGLVKDIGYKINYFQSPAPTPTATPPGSSAPTPPAPAGSKTASPTVPTVPAAPTGLTPTRPTVLKTTTAPIPVSPARPIPPSTATPTDSSGTSPLLSASPGSPPKVPTAARTLPTGTPTDPSATQLPDFEPLTDDFVSPDDEEENTVDFTDPTSSRRSGPT